MPFATSNAILMNTVLSGRSSRFLNARSQLYSEPLGSNSRTSMMGSSCRTMPIMRQTLACANCAIIAPSWRNLVRETSLVSFRSLIAAFLRNNCVRFSLSFNNLFQVLTYIFFPSMETVPLYTSPNDPKPNKSASSTDLRAIWRLSVPMDAYSCFSSLLGGT